MTMPGTWSRVAKGIRLVAGDGVSRIIGSAVVTSNAYVHGHLPDLASSLARAAVRDDDDDRGGGGAVSADAVRSSSAGGMVSSRRWRRHVRDHPPRRYDGAVDGAANGGGGREGEEVVVLRTPSHGMSSFDTGAAAKRDRGADNRKSAMLLHGASPIDIDDGSDCTNSMPLETSSGVEAESAAAPPIENSSGSGSGGGSGSEPNDLGTNDDITSEGRASAGSTEFDSNRRDNDNAEMYDDDDEHDRPHHLPEGTHAVPSTRISRAFGFASLGAGLAAGAVSELAMRALGLKRRPPISSSANDGTAGDDSGGGGGLVLSNDANARRLSESLRRMRGAAMKLGQMLSIQDESIAPPGLTEALSRVRGGAEAMPGRQLEAQLVDQWGEGWTGRIDLEGRPFAAASIGQVHRGTIAAPSSSSPNNAPGGATKTRVAVKVQYPGVADSIESDLSNLSMLVRATGLAPPGLFLDNVIRVGRDELRAECDYRLELANQVRFRSLLSSDPGLVADRFVVPRVFEELSTDRILVTELVRGGTIDRVANLDQTERNRIGRAIMRLTMLELFVWRFMQTDPNWGNFLYDVRSRTTYLIDFGAARGYDEEFVRGYLNIVIANADQDEKALIDESIRMGFLTGEENDVMLEAHKLSGFCLGEPFRSYEPYDFKSSRITSRISEHGSVFLKHRLTPPPEEVYTLHRKLAGAYNLCIKLGANISCRDLLDEVVAHYEAKESSDLR